MHNDVPQPDLAGTGTDPSRLSSVDLFRGFALFVVLLDHLDIWTGHHAVFRTWTLTGFGFCDAAEVFAFLSGFTFGRLYGVGMPRKGLLFWRNWAFVRTIRIYCSFIAAVAVVLSLAWVLRRTPASMDPLVIIDDDKGIVDSLFGAMCLSNQPYPLGILCFYVIIVPVMPLLMALGRHRSWGMVGISAIIYLVVQVEPQINFFTEDGNHWSFNPLAWQFLVVIGMACGQRREAGGRVARGSFWTVVAVGLVLYGLFVKKVVSFANGAFDFMDFWNGLGLTQTELMSKTRLAPMRLLHFLAVAHLIFLILPRDQATWRNPMVRPFVVCGRHSLIVYCAGAVLVHLYVPLFRWVVVDTLTVLMVGLNAFLLQWGFAELLDCIGSRRKQCGMASKNLLRAS